MKLRSNISLPKSEVNYDRYIYDRDLITCEINDSCICIICTNVMKNPVQCCEGHNFCKQCCMTSLNQRSECPICNSKMSLDKLMPNRGLEGVINDYKIKCPTTIQNNNSNSAENSRKRTLEAASNCSDSKIPRRVCCDWNGKIASAASHLEKDCKSYLIPCPHGDCKEIVERQDLSAHEEVCNSKMRICKWCDDEFSQSNYKLHNCIMSEDQMPCPMDCGEMTSNADLNNHFNTCSEVEIPCKYSNYGCHENMKRKDSDGHMSAAAQDHATLLEGIITQRDEVIKQKDILIKRLEHTIVNIQPLFDSPEGCSCSPPGPPSSILMSASPISSMSRSIYLTPGDESLELFMKSVAHNRDAWQRLCALADGDSEEKNFALGYQIEVYLKSDAPEAISIKRDKAKAHQIHSSIQLWLDTKKASNPMDIHANYLIGISDLWLTTNKEKKAKNAHTVHAYECIKIAASYGHIPAKRLLIQFAEQKVPLGKYTKDEKLQLGFENLKCSAVAGYVVAQVELAQYYDKKGDAESDRQSLYWNKMAADQGYVVAEYNMGVAYRTGCGCTEDLAKAERYFTLSSDKGKVEAIFQLACVLLDLNQVQEALVYMRKAKERGHIAAKNYLKSNSIK